ncbi:MAG: class I SAM-dependent methyltransferase [Candidatus Thiodiazotropha endolucinida]
MNSSTISYYEKHAAEYFNQTVNADMSHLYTPFLERVRSGGSILDAGCGSGRDLLAFAKKGFNVMGIDASAQLARMASSYSGAPVKVIDFSEMSFKDCFDGIWACASLLHIEKSELQNVLCNFRKALVHGGVLFASVREGTGTRVGSGGRAYTLYSVIEFKQHIIDAGLELDLVWVTSDVLERREKLSWINILAKKP